MDMRLLTVKQAEQCAMERLSVSSHCDWQSRSDSAQESQWRTDTLDFASSIRPSISLRSDAWLRRKHERTKELRDTLDSVELQECSFRPKIRRSAAPKNVDVDYLVRRLSIPRKVMPPPVEDVPRECTFSPDTRRSRRSFGHQNHFSTYESFYNKSLARSQPNPVAFSHHPKINAVRSNMLSCRQYIEENVFSRLARPQEQQSALVADSETSRASCSSTSLPDHFSNFLRRQNNFHRARDEKKERREQDAEDAMFKPVLCDKSRVIAARCSAEGKVVKRQASAPSFSFKPEIRPRSKVMPRRSSYAMSIGDQMKKEERVRRLRDCISNEKDSNERRQAEERVADLATVTTKAVPDSQAASLRARVAQRRTKRQLEAMNERTQRDAALTKECSFQPQIKESPAFVRRVAESYRLAREMQGASRANPHEKTGWR